MKSPFIILLALLAVTLAADPVFAEKVEVGDGIYVTKKSYRAPANEQPFFGFIEKNQAQQEADRRFLASIEKMGVSREYAFNKTVLRGWQAFHKGDPKGAARRFNQAWLIDPSQSAVLQGFAVLAATRFKDPDYAEELFEAGSRMDDRPPGYMADYGRFLLVQERPRDALPVLEEAVRETPSNPTAWSNLAFARLKAGRDDEACDAAKQARRLSPPPKVASDLNIIARSAKCDSRT